MENIGKVYETSPLLICFAPNIIFSLAGIVLVIQLNNEDRGRVLDRLKRLWEPHA